MRPGLRLLDIGCGIGGAARFFAGRHGCRVTGLDLTPEYVAVAAALTQRAGLAEQVAFQVGSALSLPFPDSSFDRATVLHVGMNIPDKDRLCAEIARVLIPGGVLGLYDVMRTGPGEIDFPVPWAASPATSFLAEPATYRRALSGAGLEIAAERPRRDLALAFFRRMRERMAAGGPPPLGLHILMGPAAPQKVANMIAAVEQGRVAPVELVCRRR